MPFSCSKYLYSWLRLWKLVDLSFQYLSFSNKRKTTLLFPSPLTFLQLPIGSFNFNPYWSGIVTTGNYISHCLSVQLLRASQTRELLASELLFPSDFESRGSPRRCTSNPAPAPICVVSVKMSLGSKPIRHNKHFIPEIQSEVQSTRTYTTVRGAPS